MDQNLVSFGQKSSEKVTSLLFRMLSSITVEPAVFLYIFGYALTSVEVPNLYIEKTCKVGSAWYGNRTFSNEVCDNIYNGSFSTEQAEIQKTVAKVEMISHFLRNTPALFFSLFLGPWSDKFGRKFLINLSATGYVLGQLALLINVFFFDQLVVEFLLLENIASLGGLYMTCFLGVYGYISDITTEKYRTVRILLCDATFSLSFAIGNLINGKLFDTLGYYGSFGFGSLCWICTIFYVTFFVKNPEKFAKKKEDEADGAETFSYLSVFSLNNIKESFMVFLKKRPNGLRHIINLLILCFGTSMLAFTGAGSLEYLFIRRSFTWPESAQNPNYVAGWYTKYMSYTQIVSLFITFVVLPILTNVIKVPDIGIVIVATLGYITNCLIFAFATARNQIFFAIPFGAIAGISTSPLRSALSKLAGPEDVGKVFAGCGALQAITSFTSPLYNLLYVHTMDFFLGFYLLVTAGIFSIEVGVLFYVLVYLLRMSRKQFTPQNLEPMTEPKFTNLSELRADHLDMSISTSKRKI